MRLPRDAVRYAVTALLLVTAASVVAASVTATESTEFVYDGETPTWQAGEGQVVRGETPLPPGANVTVTIQSNDAQQPFFVRAPATVGADGQFRATVDFSDVAAGTPAQVTVTSDGTELASTEAEVVECVDACTVPDPETPTATVDGNRSLSAGPGQVVTGTTDLPPGTEVTVSVPADGQDGETLYRANRTVGDDGRFRAVADLGRASPGSTVTVRVAHGGSELASATTEVRTCEQACNAGRSSPNVPSGDAETVRVDHYGTRLVLGTLPGQTVTGNATLPPGTELDVRVESRNESRPFSVSGETTVGENGSFSATVGNLSSVPSFTEAVVVVSQDGTEITRQSAVVVWETPVRPPPETPAATLSTRNDSLALQSEPGQVIRGTTNLPPESRLRVQVSEVTDGEGKTVADRTVLVGADRRFRDTVDLSDLQENATVRVAVSHDGTELASATDETSPCDERCTPPVLDSPSAAMKYGDFIGFNHTQKSFQVNQSEALTVPLLFKAEYATVTVGGENVSYALRARVRDGDDDNNVTLRLATDELGNDAVVTAVDESDEVTVLDRRIDGDREVLDEGRYPVRLTAGSDPGGELLGHGMVTVSDTPVDGDGNETTVPKFRLLPAERSEDEDPFPVYQTRMGETARIPLQTDEWDTATVYVRDYRTYNLTAVVRDGNGDERVDLTFDTTAANDDDAKTLTAVAPEDSVTIVTENGTLSAGEYGIRPVAGVPDGADVAGQSKGDVDRWPKWTGDLVVAEADSTPTAAGTSPGASDPGEPLTLVGLLGVAGVLACGGIAVLTGAFDR